jgi:hypothetical protein
MSAPLDEKLRCAACGRFGAHAFDGESLCADCYQERGSCCAEACRESSCFRDDARSGAADQPVTERSEKSLPSRGRELR